MNRESGIYPRGEANSPETATSTSADEQWKFDEARRLMPQEAPGAEAVPEKLDSELVERLKAKQQRIAEMAARVDASMDSGDRDEHAVAMGTRVDAAMAVEQRNDANAARLADLLKVGAERRERMTEEFHRKRNADRDALAEKTARAAVEEAASSGTDPLEKAA